MRALLVAAAVAALALVSFTAGRTYGLREAEPILDQAVGVAERAVDLAERLDTQLRLCRDGRRL